MTVVLLKEEHAEVPITGLFAPAAKGWIAAR